MPQWSPEEYWLSTKAFRFVNRSQNYFKHGHLRRHFWSMLFMLAYPGPWRHTGYQNGRLGRHGFRDSTLYNTKSSLDFLPYENFHCCFTHTVTVNGSHLNEHIMQQCAHNCELQSLTLLPNCVSLATVIPLFLWPDNTVLVLLFLCLLFHELQHRSNVLEFRVISWEKLWKWTVFKRGGSIFWSSVTEFRLALVKHTGIRRTSQAACISPVL
jgi:hypothetical protein